MACKRASNLLLLAAAWAVSLFPVFVQSADVPASSSPAPSATEATGSSLILPLPSSMPLVDYERKLYRWYG